jgi:SAM-dependent methyltransferase
MQLADLLTRRWPPVPWAEGDNIPWHEVGFSARMLAEHLSQDHDAASRRATTIDRQVAWIHGALLGGRPARVLDLGCGPGLYAGRLARLGHTCVGIDYSPAAIAHARSEAAARRLACQYHHADIRDADYGAGFGPALLIYGEFNVFSRRDAARILAKVNDALDDGGLLVLEPHTFDAVRRMGEAGTAWHTAARGLFAATPHLALREHFWDAATNAATIRYFIIELTDGSVTRYAQSMQAYGDGAYHDLLGERGFAEIAVHPSLTGATDPEQAEFIAIVARKLPAAR